LFVVVRPRGWLALVGLFTVAIAGLGWSIFARIPETVQGPGILLIPGAVRPVQARAGGQVVEVRVRPGQVLRVGDVVAVVSLPDVQEELNRAKARLAELETAEVGHRKLEELRVMQEATLRKAQEELLDRAIRESETALTRAQEEYDKLTGTNKELANAARQEVETARKSIQERVQAVRKLVEQKLLPAERLEMLEATLLENALSLANLRTRTAEAGFREVDFRQTLLTQTQRIAELKLQRVQLEVKATQLDQETAQNRATRVAIQAEQKEKVNRLTTQLREDGVVASPYAGRVVDVAVLPGQLTAPAGRIATVDVAKVGEGEPELTHLAYFPIAAGKRIEVGMEVQVTPTTLQRERYGSIVGVVKRVSAFPISPEAVGTIVGNAEIVHELSPAGAMIEVEVELRRGNTPSGFVWTSSGSRSPLTAGTTTRTRVVVNRRAPISYLIPGTRALLGEADDE
jgi:HlyD family secretion protein